MVSAYPKYIFVTLSYYISYNTCNALNKINSKSIYVATVHIIAFVIIMFRMCKHNM